MRPPEGIVAPEDGRIFLARLRKRQPVPRGEAGEKIARFISRFLETPRALPVVGRKRSGAAQADASIPPSRSFQPRGAALPRSDLSFEVTLLT